MYIATSSPLNRKVPHAVQGHGGFFRSKFLKNTLRSHSCTEEKRPDVLFECLIRSDLKGGLQCNVGRLSVAVLEKQMSRKDGARKKQKR